MQRSSEYKNKYGFIGKEKDTESGLNYVEARYYDSGIGRFVSQDRVFWEMGQTKRGIEVLGDPQNMNAYGYARNNPVNFSDKSGEFTDAIYFRQAWSIFPQLALSDGPVPIGDIIGGVVIIGAMTVDAAINIGNYIESKFSPKKEEYTQVASVASTGSPAPGGGDKGNKKKDEKKNNNKEGRSTGKQDKELSKGEIKKLQDKGYDIHDLKPQGNGSKFDLFKNKDGEIYFKRKTGRGESEPTFVDININKL